MDISKLIDHTKLKPDLCLQDIDKLCDEAIQHQFAAVCIPPYFVKHASVRLKDESPNVCTVVGFPMGYSCTPSKVEEARKAIDEGANEIDMVVNVCAIKDGNWNYLKNDIQSVTTLTQMMGGLIKVIVETGILSDEELKRICDICIESNAEFIKTSTGFNGVGAETKKVKLIKSIAGDSIKIKASGGIKTKEFAIELIENGAERIGTSSGLIIVA